MDIINNRKTITVRTYSNGIIKDVTLDKHIIKEINKNMQDLLDKLTETAWTTYCKNVNNKSVRGESLPTWQQLKSDNNKIQIVNAWRAAVESVISDYEKYIG